MSTTVFLVRHGSHGLLDRVLVGRAAGVALSAAGRRETDELAAWFADRGLDVVQSSPRQRACETAAALAAAVGTAVEIAPALDEIDFGQWTGRAFAELAPDPRWQAWNAVRGLERAPGGETMLEAQSRIVGHIERLGRTLSGKAAVLVSHCDVIRAALLHYLGRPLDAYGEIEIAPASVSAIDLAPGGVGGVALNLRGAP